MRTMSTRRRGTMGGSSSKPAQVVSNRLDHEHVRNIAVTSTISDLQQLCAQFHKICSHPGCQVNLPPPVYDQLFETWAAGSQQIPPQTQLSVLVCHEGHLTCVGCGKSPAIDPTKSVFTTLGIVNHCCDRGRLFAIWWLLARFDEANLLSKTTRKKDGKKAKPIPKPTGKAKAVSGVGYGDHGAMHAWEMMEGIGGNPYATYQASQPCISTCKPMFPVVNQKMHLEKLTSFRPVDTQMTMIKRRERKRKCPKTS